MFNKKLVLSAFISSMIFHATVEAQVAIGDEARNACVKDEMIALTVKGAGLGAMAGLGSALFGNKKEDALKKAAAGAAVGGAAGFATAYFTANENCNKKNPSWIPESKLERTQGYEEVKAATKYKPSEGIKVQATTLLMPNRATAGTNISVESNFIVLTPNGEEMEVTIERKLFVIDNDGKENALPYNGQKIETMTFQPGGNKDTGNIKIPEKTPVGTKFRYEFSVSAGGKPTSSVQGIVAIN